MSRKKTGREGLLVWLQCRTAGYKNVNVVDFTDSWVDGTRDAYPRKRTYELRNWLAFCALLHSFCPGLVKYEELKPTAKVENLDFAFRLAEKLGIPRLIEPTDMLVETGPNKFFVITYLAQFVDHFKRQENKPEPAPLSFLRQCDAPSTNTSLSTSLVKEAEHKLRIRSCVTKSNATKSTRNFDRVNLVKGGKIAGTIRELKRKISASRLTMTPPVERRRGGTVVERVAEFNRRTGAQTTHITGDPFISERNVPAGLVAERIATFLKMQSQVKLDIEFIMVTSPKMRRAKKRDGQSPLPNPQLMSNIYYVMRPGETTPRPNTKNPSVVRNPTVRPLGL